MHARGSRSIPARIVASALCALLLACAPTPAEYQAPGGVALLGEAQIRDRFVGNTLTGVIGGNRWWEYYAPDGTLRGVLETAGSYRGDWRVDGPRLCWDYPGDEYDGCYTVAIEDGAVQLYTLEGEAFRGPRELLAGNPLDL